MLLADWTQRGFASTFWTMPPRRRGPGSRELPLAILINATEVKRPC